MTACVAHRSDPQDTWWQTARKHRFPGTRESVSGQDMRGQGTELYKYLLVDRRCECTINNSDALAMLEAQGSQCLKICEPELCQSLMNEMNSLPHCWVAWSLSQKYTGVAANIFGVFCNVARIDVGDLVSKQFDRPLFLPTSTPIFFDTNESRNCRTPP